MELHLRSQLGIGLKGFRSWGSGFGAGVKGLGFGFRAYCP